MKILAVFMIVASTLLTGCVVAEPQYQGYGRGDPHRGQPSGDRDRDGIPNYADRDRDGDGVRNSQDRRPDDPRRY